MTNDKKEVEATFLGEGQGNEPIVKEEVDDEGNTVPMTNILGGKG